MKSLPFLKTDKIAKPTFFVTLQIYISSYHQKNPDGNNSKKIYHAMKK